MLLLKRFRERDGVAHSGSERWDAVLIFVHAYDNREAALESLSERHSFRAGAFGATKKEAVRAKLLEEW